MIQDIYPSKLYNEFQADASATPEDVALVFRGAEVLCKQADETGLIFPTVGDIGADRTYTYLFAVNDTRYFLLDEDCEAVAPLFYLGVREARNQCKNAKEEAFALYTAEHLRTWYRDTQFCGRCGRKMAHSQKERAMKCECGYTAYPRIMPAVIVGVIHGNRILLTKYRTGFPHYALVAGFTEIGETVEETVAREVMEETGVRVKNIRYYKSQPWGIANDILLGYYCDVDGDDTIHMDDNELKFAEWVAREDIVLQPDNYSLTNEMMKRFQDGLDC